jgi:peroxiredoxin
MLPLGTAAPNFTLPGTDGKTYRLADFEGAAALLIVFTCNHCPYAQAVEARLIQLAHDYHEQGLAVVFINSNDAVNYPEDSFPSMQRRAREKKFPFPYLYDESQSVARAYSATCTPDPFLFDAECKLVYRGRIDDNWKEPDKVTRQDLRDAIEAVLAGDPLPGEQLASMGCNIKWKEN